MTIVHGTITPTVLSVSADTQCTYPDGRTYYATKLKVTTLEKGSYVFGCSTTNLNAADTLTSKIISALSFDPKSLIGVESIIESTMMKWYQAFSYPEDRAAIQILCGASIKAGSDGSDSELGLYICEPPNSINRITPENSEGYCSIGEGKIVTDSLFKTLFGKVFPVPVLMSQISYLMYRAKLDCAGSVGGDTDVVILKKGGEKPIWIERIDLKIAESFGPHLDNVLSRAAYLVTSSGNLEDHREVLELASQITRLNLTYCRITFRDKETHNPMLV